MIGLPGQSHQAGEGHEPPDCGGLPDEAKLLLTPAFETWAKAEDG